MKAMCAMLAAGMSLAVVHGARAQDDSAWVVQETTAPDAAPGMFFGSAATLRGATAVIGADADLDYGGSAYVFTNAGGVWTATQKLAPADGGGGDEFGYRTLLNASGDRLLVGAFSATIDGNLFQGAAYVFDEGADGTWTETQKLVADDGIAGDNFGAAVAFAGTSVFVGAMSALGSQGAVYRYASQDGSWVQTQKLVADDGVPIDDFGIALAGVGDTLFVGAANAVVDGQFAAGAVYVFENQGGDWVQTQKLVADDAVGGAAFGLNVAFDGTTAVVGAPGAVSAYVYTSVGGVWTFAQKVSGADSVPGDNFGSTISVDGAQMLIGGDVATIDGDTSRGAAYLFRNGQGGWAQTHKFVADDGQTDDFFGLAVALEGDTALISTLHPNANTGAAYFFARDTLFADGFDPTP